MKPYQLIFILFLISSFSLAQETKSTKNVLIKFESDAPLELIKAESNECEGILNLKTSEFVFRVKIRSFEGFNSPLQKEHFNENYMESELIPNAYFKGEILDDIDYTELGQKKVTIKGGLEIHGVEDERVMELLLEVKQDGSITFYSEFEVELETHDIEVPRIVYQKISEIIFVSVSGVLN